MKIFENFYVRYYSIFFIKVDSKYDYIFYWRKDIFLSPNKIKKTCYITSTKLSIMSTYLANTQLGFIYLSFFKISKTFAISLNSPNFLYTDIRNLYNNKKLLIYAIVL